MRKSQFGRLTLALLLVFSSRCAGSAGGAVGDANVSVAKQIDNDAAMGTKRILPSEVRLSNLDAFEAQMREDLPKGTKRQDVRRYLDKWNISKAYADDEHAYYCTIEYIGMRAVFRASLAIRIYFDAYEDVDHIVFRVDYL